MCENILLRSLFFCLLRQLHTVSYLCELLGKYLIVCELHNAPIIRQVFFDYNFQRLNVGWQFESCVAACSCSSSERRFLEGILHKVGCGGIFNYHFIANLSQSLKITEF